MRANLPDASWFQGRNLPNRTDIVLQQLIKSGNDGHVFKGHSDLLARDWACKVIPRTNLVLGVGGKEVWRSEVLKANPLTNSAVVKFEQQIEDWKDDAAGVDCVVLVSEFVEGCDLKDFIAKNKGRVTVSFVTSFLTTMLNLFHEMKLRGVPHGDLHAANILVQDRSAYDLLSPRHVFRVTDFGVAEATSDRRFKDDFDQLADVLRQLLEQVSYTAGSLKEKFVFNVINDRFLARYLTERDTTREPIARQPEALFLELQGIEAEFDKYAGEGIRLLYPFDFLNCEQIGDDESLLKSLYSDRFLGLEDIQSRNNVVVTGPRGCGKSTVFKSLSLHHKSQVGEDAPAETQYFGVYYRCLDLYFAFPRYVIPGRPEALDIPIHFVTATLLAGLCEVTELVGSNPAQNWNEDARQIRRVRKITIWGKESLSNLCSGDIHYVINLVASMVNAVGGEAQLRQSENTPKVSASVQDKCIREEAGEFLRNLRGSCEHGDKLVAIASAFGIVANSFLRWRNSTNEKGEPPWQACRIEPHEALSLTGPAQNLYDELLRYSVFIEDDRGKSRRGKTVPRLCLRRFLIPYFNLTFSGRDSIPLEPEDIELLLTAPDQFEAKFRRRGPDEPRDGELPLG